MTKTFIDIVTENFEKIQRNFRAGLKDKGYSYDEDIMSDAFISCNNALKDRKLTEKEALKYYWTAYINKYKTKLLSNRLSLVNDIEDFDIIEDTYDETIDKIYNIVIEAIREKFGLKDAYIWEMYVCQGKSAKAIRNLGFNVDNFVYFTRKIKRFITNHLIQNNKELQELIKYRKEV